MPLRHYHVQTGRVCYGPRDEYDGTEWSTERSCFTLWGARRRYAALAKAWEPYDADMRIVTRRGYLLPAYAQPRWPRFKRWCARLVARLRPSEDLPF